MTKLSRDQKLSRRERQTLLSILAILLFVFPAGLRAQDVPAPPDLWNLATGERIPGDDVLKTKEFGVVAKGEAVKKWHRKRGVEIDKGEGPQPGDIILAVDGFRVYGSRDFELARFKDPLATTMSLLINRQGDLLWLKLHDLQPGRALATGFDTDAERDRILNALESLGLPLSDEKVRTSLLQLPAQAAVELDQWSKKSPSDTETGWLQEFIKLFTAVQGRDYAVAKPAHEPPIPYFQRLEKFYLWLADENKAREVAPNLKKSGEFPEFYVLALPVPDYQPPLGDLKFSDRRFQALLMRRYALAGHDDPEIATAAQKYAASGSNGLDLYMDQVRAALLDPVAQGGWPYRSFLLAQPVSRNLLVQTLSDRMKEPSNSVDWPINAYAMIALDWAADGKTDQIAPLLAELGKRSPYLARSAAAGLFYARHLEKRPWKLLAPTKTVLAQTNSFMGPGVPVLYNWAVSKIQTVGVSMQLVDGSALPDPYYLLTRAPYAELVALKGGDVPPPAAAPSPDE